MQIVRYIAFSTTIAIASCQSTKKAATAAPKIQQQEMVPASQAADAFQSNAAPLQKGSPSKNDYTDQPAMVGFSSIHNLQESKEENQTQPQTETAKNDLDEMAVSFSNKQNREIQSFAQVKQMVTDKQINLSKKQLKRIDKLDNKYHGDFNKFKDDASSLFDTQTSKIIAAVGVVGLLLLIVSGSGFGAFLLILSVGALLLKWLHIISF